MYFGHSDCLTNHTPKNENIGPKEGKVVILSRSPTFKPQFMQG
jgi:hypothetical protein